MIEIFIKVGLVNLQVLSPKNTLLAFKEMSNESKQNAKKQKTKTKAKKQKQRQKKKIYIYI